MTDATLMTLNLRRDVPEDGPNAWPHRRDAIAEMVLRHRPTLLATQEGTLPMLRDLDARLPGYERVGGEREHWPGEEPNALFVDPARVRVVDAGVLWLSRTPLVVGSRSWGDWAQRSALWALVAWRETGAASLVVNTHFDHISLLSRVRSAQLLERVAPGAILLGDFNALPGSPTHRILLPGRADPLLGGPSTHDAFRGRPTGRIDWVLVPRGERVLGAEVVRDARPDGGPLSDHLPVAVALAAPRAQAPAPEGSWARGRPVPTRLPPAAPAALGALAQGA